METQKDLFKHGPLYKDRFGIINHLKTIGLKSGDILYRYSDAKGPLNLPFCRIVTRLTKSEYSHAAILFMENNEPHVLEINDQGTLRYRLLDWMDTCVEGAFSIYRLNDLDDTKEAALLKEIYLVLETDPDYDFTFSDPNKFYCTESVVEIYRNSLGVELDPGYLIKDVVPNWTYILLRIGVGLFSFFGTSLPFDQKLYFVGNEQRGMMSSPLTKLIIKITES